MTQTAWLHIGILLLAFVGVVAFILRRMVFPAAREGAHGESVGIGGGYSGGHGDHSHDSGGGDGGSGD
ncbi:MULTISPECIES: hypothetical protein [unclassified Mesorhizobium]|uniref:hypothetical protein n=1 Tax=unclassified Mesorhizobium TaxID=325217 RepID=UPI0003CFBC8E|nr:MULTISPECIES: hypothetical protein [unclassified Mesorhizobium]ESZ24570.1 hypothetical protein X734_22040 [Mesorhizobium sp. L2C084A000]RUW93411.1 hypothetical protein EOA19_08100 [Mesorhizobium sp. M7A.F.Ca.US.010.02.1.1]